MMRAGEQQTGGDVPGAPSGTTPEHEQAIDSDELEAEDLELDDVAIDEADLPELDLDDPEAVAPDRYEELLDHAWLERRAEGEVDEEAELEGVGLTIEIDDLGAEEDGAQVVEIDVGSLLTSLPGDITELDLEPGPSHERGDPGLAVGALRDVLPPDSETDGDELDADDQLVGDDDRFPAFDDPSDIAPRSEPDADDLDVGHDELT